MGALPFARAPSAKYLPRSLAWLTTCSFRRSTIPGVRTLIWLSVKPLIKLVIPAAAGFSLSRHDLFPPAASRGASQVILNVTLPALLFSKIVPSFTSDNVAAIGPIMLVGAVYMGISLALGLVIRAVFPTPKNFRFGLLAAATWSNWGDLPTSVVQTVCASAPFSGTTDANLAVAYVAIFILLFYVTLFPLQGIHLIERDYTHPPKPLPSLEDGVAGDGEHWRLAKVRAAGRRMTGLVRRHKSAERAGDAALGVEKVSPGLTGVVVRRASSSRSGPPPPFTDLRRHITPRLIDSASVRAIASAAHAAAPTQTPDYLTAASASTTSPSASALALRRGSFGRAETPRMHAGLSGEQLKTALGSTFGENDGEITEVGTERMEETLGGGGKEAEKGAGGGEAFPVTSPQTTLGEDELEKEKEDELSDEEQVDGGRPARAWAVRVLVGVRGFVRSLLTPPTISLLTALVCALVDRLKALFTEVPNYSWHPTAPDGDPPLAIILDTSTFVGAASVPLGLFVLGSALSRMRIPRPISRLPLPSIFALALAKLVLLPIVGFVLVERLANHTSLVRADNHVLRFVLVYFSCVPTATTQIFAPEDGESNSDVLSAYLIVQYCVFAISSVVLTALTLRSIF
ncbi:hypothetical protein JCM1841_005570 [Sporobolomyces salmonicolor]